MSETSLGQKNALYNQQDYEPELMESSRFQQEKQLEKQQNQQSIFQQQQNPQYQQHHEDNLQDRTTPFTFTVQNMPKINCFNHQGQTFTNFCKCRECLLPLCPECVKEHVYEHSEYRSYPKLECLENILTDVHKEVCQQANQLVYAYLDIQKSISQALSYTQETVQKLKEAKNRILNIVEQYFHALEIELENKQRKNFDNFDRDGKSFTQVLNARFISHINFLDKLKQPDCMYSLLPYLLSTTKEDNLQYIETAQSFSSRFKEAQSQINFDSIESSNLSQQIAQIVNVVHKDLPEFLDIHKLATPEIISNRVLTVKSQNSQLPQQTSRIQEQIQLNQLKEKPEPPKMQQQPGLELSYGYQQQQKMPLQQVPIQQVQNPSFYSGYPQQQQQVYGQQPFKQAQLISPNKYQGYSQTLQPYQQLQAAYPNFNTQFSNQAYSSQSLQKLLTMLKASSKSSKPESHQKISQPSNDSSNPLKLSRENSTKNVSKGSTTTLIKPLHKSTQNSRTSSSSKILNLSQRRIASKETSPSQMIEQAVLKAPSKITNKTSLKQKTQKQNDGKPQNLSDSKIKQTLITNQSQQPKDGSQKQISVLKKGINQLVYRSSSFNKLNKSLNSNSSSRKPSPSNKDILITKQKLSSQQSQIEQQSQEQLYQQAELNDQEQKDLIQQQDFQDDGHQTEENLVNDQSEGQQIDGTLNEDMSEQDQNQLDQMQQSNNYSEQHYTENDEEQQELVNQQLIQASEKLQYLSNDDQELIENDDDHQSCGLDINQVDNQEINLQDDSDNQKTKYQPQIESIQMDKANYQVNLLSSAEDTKEYRILKEIQTYPNQIGERLHTIQEDLQSNEAMSQIQFNEMVDGDTSELILTHKTDNPYRKSSVNFLQKQSQNTSSTKFLEIIIQDDQSQFQQIKSAKASLTSQYFKVQNQNDRNFLQEEIQGNQNSQITQQIQNTREKVQFFGKKRQEIVTKTQSIEDEEVKVDKIQTYQENGCQEDLIYHQHNDQMGGDLFFNNAIKNNNQNFIHNQIFKDQQQQLVNELNEQEKYQINKFDQEDSHSIQNEEISRDIKKKMQFDSPQNQTQTKEQSTVDNQDTQQEKKEISSSFNKGNNYGQNVESIDNINCSNFDEVNDQIHQNQTGIRDDHNNSEHNIHILEHEKSNEDKYLQNKQDQKTLEFQSYHNQLRMQSNNIDLSEPKIQDIGSIYVVQQQNVKIKEQQCELDEINLNDQEAKEKKLHLNLSKLKQNQEINHSKDRFEINQIESSVNQESMYIIEKDQNDLEDQVQNKNTIINNQKLGDNHQQQREYEQTNCNDENQNQSCDSDKKSVKSQRSKKSRITNNQEMINNNSSFHKNDTELEFNCNDINSQRTQEFGETQRESENGIEQFSSSQKQIVIKKQEFESEINKIRFSMALNLQNIQGFNRNNREDQLDTGRTDDSMINQLVGQDRDHNNAHLVRHNFEARPSIKVKMQHLCLDDIIQEKQESATPDNYTRSINPTPKPGGSTKHQKHFLSFGVQDELRVKQVDQIGHSEKDIEKDRKKRENSSLKKQQIQSEKQDEEEIKALQKILSSKLEIKKQKENHILEQSLKIEEFQYILNHIPDIQELDGNIDLSLSNIITDFLDSHKRNRYKDISNMKDPHLANLMRNKFQEILSKQDQTTQQDPEIKRQQQLEIEVKQKQQVNFVLQLLFQEYNTLRSKSYKLNLELTNSQSKLFEKMKKLSIREKLIPQLKQIDIHQHRVTNELKNCILSQKTEFNNEELIGFIQSELKVQEDINQCIQEIRSIFKDRIDQIKQGEMVMEEQLLSKSQKY
ncbi:unnamed protein product (macronuclear) [Paramecium tetraurelia]|uniref:B box-type domain-containing protein n=1 Tax=Paramecium tetraurelia TaxID=5888 RepID=A0E637_PARTE|nr:uncharacterized protein GSPATT00003617001 [Paramecium tetraurelia]CAK90754.1 unnamed protein product [Paramecium tetraurelia]|eukprot:XP_001458151.1 hypothetical protein (macronuclear) [Paramecium tetraurelia strain d4-2]